MKKLSKILVLLLSVALVCAGLILAVSADDGNVAKIGETEYATLAAAFDAANAVTDGTTTTITLLNDVTVSSTIQPKTNVTLDLNGHTLTNTTTAFKPQNDNTTFTITGEGNIVSKSQIVYMKGWGSGDVLLNRNVNVIGTGDGIKITYENSTTATDGKLFIMDAGVWTFENLDITATFNRATSSTDTTAKAEQLFYAKNLNSATTPTLKMNFNNVKIDATAQIMTSSVIHAEAHTQISMKNCDVKTNGANVFVITNAKATSDYIVIEDSRIDVAKYSGYGTNATAGAIFGSSYSTLASDIIVKNSYLSSVRRNLAGSNYTSNNAIILDNSVWNSKTSQPLSRSSNIVLKNGSAITYDADFSALFDGDNSTAHTYPLGSNGATCKNLVFYEGTRICHNTYRALVAKAVNSGRTSFEDGTAINSANPTYVFVYDPAGNADAPFLVVKASDANNYDMNYANGTGYLYYYSESPVANSNVAAWNPNGVYGNDTVNGNIVWTHYNDVANNTNKQPNYVFCHPTGINQSSYNVVVYDMDFAADSLNGFTDTEFGLHARGTSGTTGSGNQAVAVFKIENGVINTSGYLSGGDQTTFTLETDKWHHFTVVIDTTNTKGNAYVYVDGVYLGTRQAWATDENTTAAYLFGTRLNVYANAASNRTGITVDNTSVRVDSALSDTVTATALTDKGASYLLNGGLASNTGVVSNGLTVDGTAYSTIDEAITAGNAAGVVPELNVPVSIDQTVTVDGTINTNGYTIPLASNSIPYTVTYDTDGTTPISYTFDSTMTASVNFIFSYKGDTYGPFECAIGDNLTELYASVITAADFINKTADNHFQSRELLGWTLTEDGTEIVVNEILDAEFAGAHNGETVTLYPVFSEYQQKFTWVVTNTNGFVRGGEDTVITTAVWNNTIKLTYGETLVLQQNIVAVNAFSVTNKNSSAAKTIGLDLNGHTLTVDPHYTAATIPNGSNKKIFGFWVVNVGETHNVYSTNAGGKIESFGAEAANFSGGLLFLMNSQGGSKNRDVIGNATRATDNTHLTIGTFGDIPGSNLTLCAGGIIDLDDGDSTCTVTMDGITAIKNSYDCSFISQRAYYGTLDVKNSTLIITCGYTSVIMENGSGCKTTDSDGNTVYSAATVTFENCTIIHSANNKNVVSGDNAFNSITFKNCITNGTINGKKTIVDAGTQYVNIGTTAKVASDVTAAKWNQPMTVDGNTMTVTFYTINDDRTEYVPNNYVIASYGYTGDAKIVLPTLTYKAVTEDDTVNVTYTGYDGATTNVLYAVGGNVVDYKLSNYEGKALTFEHNGTYQEDYATNLVADGTYVYTTTLANYTVLEANIKDLQANVSLYADFGVNLYIPSGYEEYVKVFNGDAEIAPTKTTSYLKYTITQLCNKASENVTFKITITEEGHSVDTTASVSIATYAEAVLGGEYTDADKVLVYYMLNYANEAAKYIGGAEDTAIATLLENNATVAAKYTVSAEYDEYIENQGLASVFDTVAIDLNGTPAFVLNLEAGFEGTVTVSYAKGKASREFNIAEASDEIVALTVEGMKAYNFGTVLTITAEGTLNGEAVAITGTYSLDTYVKDVETAGEDCAALAKALRAYAEVSELYKNQTLDDAIAEQAAAEDTPSGEETPAA